MLVNKVTFYSPGTFFSEDRTLLIDSWDVARAAALAEGIIERHGARPYGFQFSEWVTADAVDDGMGGKLEVQPRKLRSSGMHYLGGEITRYEDVPDDHETSILRTNMRCNGWAFIITNRNSYRFTQPFNEGDCIVEHGVITVRGNDPELMEYRQRQQAEFDKRYQAV